jgi:hypothetical protein
MRLLDCNVKAGTGYDYLVCEGTIIIIIDLITLPSIYVLGNIHLFQTVSGTRLSQGKEIRPIH